MRNIKSTTLQQPLSEDALFIVFQQEFFKLKPEDCLKLKLRLYFTFATLLVITNKCQSYIYPEEPRIIKLSMTENCTTPVRYNNDSIFRSKYCKTTRIDSYVAFGL